MISAKISVSIKGNKELDKQTTFALASALTLTAKEAQTSVIESIERTFTVRTNWDKPSNIFGVRIKPATKQNLVAVVGTAADWLEKFMRGEGVIVNLPQGKFLAVPTTNVRRSKRDLILRAQRPKMLLGKRDVLLPMKSKKGFVLFQRQGRGHGSRLVALYILTPQAKIKQKDVLFAPVEKTFQKRFPEIYAQQLQKAFATAR